MAGHVVRVLSGSRARARLRAPLQRGTRARRVCKFMYVCMCVLPCCAPGVRAAPAFGVPPQSMIAATIQSQFVVGSSQTSGTTATRHAWAQGVQWRVIHACVCVSFRVVLLEYAPRKRSVYRHSQTHFVVCASVAAHPRFARRARTSNGRTVCDLRSAILAAYIASRRSSQSSAYIHA